MIATPDFRIRTNGLFYDLVSVASGQPVVELIDCRADALAYAEEYQADLDARRAAEAQDEADPVADYRAESDELDAIYREIARRYDAGLPATAPRNVAVRLCLEAIDGMDRPVPADLARAA